MRDKKGRFIKGYPANPATQFKKGERRSPKTEFKKGNISWSKLHPDYQDGEKHWNWKGGKPKCKNCSIQLVAYKAIYCNPCSNRILKGGKNHSRWKGGITPLRKSIREMPEYNKWRLNIFIRDNFICHICGKNARNNCNADHYPIAFSEILQTENIKSLENARNSKLLWILDNGRTLCIPCHQETPNYLRRKI